MRCPWLLAQMKVATIFGIFSLVVLLVTTLTKTPEWAVLPEGFVLQFWNFAWALKSQKCWESNEKRFWVDKGQNGLFLPEGFVLQFLILHGLLSNTNIMNPMRKYLGDSPYTPN